MQRCRWAQHVPEAYQAYHDHEWGVPCHDDRTLLEMLILEGAQAGLAWWSILQRREGYRQAFGNFDAVRLATMTDAELEHVLTTGNIIRNRLKVRAARQNAQVFLRIQHEYGTFDAYLWSFVGGTPQINRPATHAEVPTTSPEAEKLSKDLKKRGMSFVGPTIMYAYMQAVGLVNDHTQDCACCPKA